MKSVLTIVCGCALLWALPADGKEPKATDTKARAAAAKPAMAKPWPHEVSDIKPDARVIWGKLDNGLRYAILPTNVAPARGSLRMLVLAGSGMEADDQQGMAHFLEHMAFNGTKHFAAGETFEYFQRLGMAFGAHTNAATNFDHTVYQLELPRTNEALTTDGLKLFRDFLDGMLLDEKEIERERGVILSEALARNTSAYRTAAGTLKSALAGTIYANRLPIGTVESIRKLTRERFVDFYETWYTPGRTVIVATGDFDKEMVENLIRKQFGDAKARRGEAADPAVGKLIADRGVTARYNHVADAGSVTVSLSRVTPDRRGVEMMAQQKVDILDLLVNRMIGERLDKISELPNSPIQAASIDNERLFNVVDRRDLSAKCVPQKWEAAVTLVEQELRRALEHGFTQAELAEAKLFLTNVFQAVAEQEETRQPDKLADEIVEALNDQNVFTKLSAYKDLIDEFVPQVTGDDCRKQLAAHWSTDDGQISVSGNVELGDDAEKRILAVFRAARSTTLDAPKDAAESQFAYTEFGPAGEIVDRREHSDLGVVQAKFANNVRVNLKPTPFEKGKVRVVVRFGGGMLEMPADKAGLQLFTQAAFIAGGLKDLSLNDLNRQIGNKNVGVMFAVGDDAFQIGGNCTPASLELQLQVCAAYLTAPGFRPEAAQQFAEAMDGVYSQRAHTLEGMVRYDGNAFLRSNDARFVLPAKEAIAKLTLDDVRGWLARPLAEGFLEVTIVGDFDADAALKLVGKTLGALPKRDEVKPSFSEARKLVFPTEPKAKTLECISDAPRAVMSVCWPAPGAADTSLSRRLYVLKLVLADRLRLKFREELGASYSPSVVYYSSDVYPDFGYLAAQLVVDPAQLAEIGPLAISTAAELASGSISDDEFDRALKPAISDIELQRRDNDYWLGAICDAQERPTALDEIRSKLPDYSSIKKAEIEKLAKAYLQADGATLLSVAPAKGESTEAAGAR